MVRRLLQGGCIGLSRAYVHVTVDQGGINTDDLHWQGSG
jgi:hypothetical protein